MSDTIPHSERVKTERTAAGNPRVCSHKVYFLPCEEYDLLEERAAGACELCRKPFAKLHIDHDHSVGTFAVRGLVCPACNAHMRRIDNDERQPDERTRKYMDQAFWRIRGYRARRNGRTTNVSEGIYWYRIPREIRWRAAMAAEARGESLTDITRVALERYIEESDALTRYVKRSK